MNIIKCIRPIACLYFVFLCCWQGNAQSVDVVVGNETSSGYITPFNNFYRHSWTECIYPASEITESGYITQVAWYCSSATDFTMSTLEIYMGTTSRTDHSSTSDWQSLNDLELVYSGTNIQVPNNTGWHNFVLDDAFEYNGNGNLVVVVAKTAPNYVSGLKYNYTSRNNSVLYRRSDSNTSYATHPGSATGTRSGSEANIRLSFSSVLCPSPQSLTVTNITAESATVSWVGNTAYSGQWEIGYGTSQAAAMQNLTVVNETHYELMGLDPETEYYVVVRSICADANSVWKVKLFKTACAGNFESGNCFDLSDLNSPNITCTYGTFSNPYNHTGVVTNRHTVISIPGYDSRTNNTLPTIPECESYSIRLGNENTGAEAESISVSYLVDTANADLLILKYAVVMQDPGHTASEQPRFTLEILNQNDQLVDNVCGYDDFIASSGLGWSSSGNVIWNEWTTVGMDLSSYHGQNVKIRLTTRDCDQGGHYGYAYFTLNCGSRRMKSKFCGTDSVKTFMAPAGFRYQWFWESQPQTILSTSRLCMVEGEHQERIVCKVTSLQKDQCYFYIYGTMEPRYPWADFSSNPNQCARTCQFNNLSRVSSDGITPNAEYEPCDDAYWDFGDGTHSTLYNPSHQYAQPGTYSVKLISGLNGFGCADTIIHTVSFPYLSAQIDTVACDSIRINNVLYTSSGNYIQTLTSTTGCDSTLNIHLTIEHSKSTSFTQLACESYDWNGTTYEESGTYQQHFQTQTGCDSLVTMHLGIGHPVSTDITDTACGSYVWNHETYTMSGNYPQHFHTIYGCDSLVTLHLTIGHDTTTSFSAIACENYTWNNINYTQSGNYTQYLQTCLGCDSTVNMHLSIGHPEYTLLVDTICSGENYNKYNFHVAHNQIQNLNFYETDQTRISQYGCDSTVHLQLTILDTALTIIPLNDDFCENMFQELEVQTDFLNYVWNTGDVSQIIVVTEPGEYSVTASYKQCTATKSYIIQPCSIPVYVPNTITPGTGDGDNDYFSMYTEAMDYVEEFEICIYNRWGNLVYTSKDPQFKWDGKVNGRLLLNQIYSYRIKMTTVFKEKHFIKGTVIVL